MSLFAELKRRNVIRVGIAYVVAAWVILQVADLVLEAIEAPSWVLQAIMLVVALGFIAAVIIAWAYELTPEGIKLERDVERGESVTHVTARKLDRIIMGFLVVAVAYFALDKFVLGNKGSDPISSPATNAADAIGSERLDPTPLEVPTQATGEKSIAVLPFTHRSADPDDIYFTDGVHDDLLTQLAKIGDLSVISRTSVMEYRDTTKNLRQIGEELGVANIMEGAVQRAGDRVRINVQLIDADTDEHLWAETYDRRLSTETLFEIQSEIAQAIAAALRATLTDTEIASVGETPTDNVHAYELYLQARRFTIGISQIGYQTALDLFEEALKLDPEFKLAWIGKARAHMTNYWVYGGDPADREAARQAIDRARTIDPDFGELYLAEGFYHYWGHLDYDRALENLDRAIAMLPGNAEAWMWRGWASRRSGRWDDALTSMAESLRLDPRMVFHWTEYAQTLFYQGYYERARTALQRAQDLDPDDFWVKTEFAHLELLESGNLDAALTLTLGAQHTDEPGHVFSYMLVRYLARRFDEVMTAARDIPDDMEQQLHVLMLRDDYVGQALFLDGRIEEARIVAQATLERLAALREELGDDHRLYPPAARMLAILGQPEEVIVQAEKGLAAAPADAVEGFHRRFDYARALGMAGLVSEAIELLDELLGGPSQVSVPWLELDPAFDAIREQSEFVALLERHR